MCPLGDVENLTVIRLVVNGPNRAAYSVSALCTSRLRLNVARSAYLEELALAASWSSSLIRRDSVRRNRKDLHKKRVLQTISSLDWVSCMFVLNQNISVKECSDMTHPCAGRVKNMNLTYVESKAFLLWQCAWVNLQRPQPQEKRVKALFITFWVHRIALQDGIMPSCDYYQTCIFMRSRICNKNSTSSCEFLWHSSNTVSRRAPCQVFKARRISA